jgi:hypothetical protein
MKATSMFAAISWKSISFPWPLPSKNGVPRKDVVNQAHFGRNLDGHAVAHAGQFRRILSFVPKPS